MNKERIIINIEDDIPQIEALEYVKAVMSLGRISKNEESYCFCSKFTDKTLVLADKKKADIFYVRKVRWNSMGTFLLGVIFGVVGLSVFALVWNSGNN